MAAARACPRVAPGLCIPPPAPRAAPCRAWPTRRAAPCTDRSTGGCPPSTLQEKSRMLHFLARRAPRLPHAIVLAALFTLAACGDKAPPPGPPPAVEVGVVTVAPRAL